MIDAALAERERLLHDAIERAHEKWYDGGCHETGCGCVTVYIQREVLPLLAACANEALERGREQVLLHLSDELAQEIRDVLKSMDEANAALKAEG